MNSRETRAKLMSTIYGFPLLETLRVQPAIDIPRDTPYLEVDTCNTIRATCPKLTLVEWGSSERIEQWLHNLTSPNKWSFCGRSDGIQSSRARASFM